jgi:hypothetical protein
MEAGSGQLNWAHDKVSPRSKEWPFRCSKGFGASRMRTLEAVKGDHAMQFRTPEPCADGKPLPSHKVEWIVQAIPVGVLTGD